jgi:hypothetical protein
MLTIVKIILTVLIIVIITMNVAFSEQNNEFPTTTGRTKLKD